MPRRRKMGAITPTERRAITRRGQLSWLASHVAAVSAIVLAASASLLAHDPGLSAMDVRIQGQEIIAVLSLASSDASAIGDGHTLATVARESIDVSVDGRTLTASATSNWTDANGGAHVRLAYPRANGLRVVIRSRLLADLPRSHRQLVSIRGEDGAILQERMLDVVSCEIAADVAATVVNGQSSFAWFVALGVRHILTGYDHLLFLAGVLVVLRTWRDVIRTITAFTLAHSITLALATTGLVAAPSRVVEPLIAASIVVVGIENLIRSVQGSRWRMTFGFGLVHGLGFASALRDVGIGTTGGAIALPLAGFNLGVELGQIAVAAILVPLFWRLAADAAPRFRFATAWSGLVIAAGSYWLIVRIV